MARYSLLQVSAARYEGLLRAEMQENFPHLGWIDARFSRKRIHLIARWRVFKKLKDLNFSLSAIGRTAGFDHSTIFSALKRLARYEAALDALYEEEWPTPPVVMPDPLLVVLEAAAAA